MRAGATLVGGGTREGAFVAPTILADVPVDQAVFREETFGPVVPIVAFDSVEEAVALANDSRYGLQAAVFTRDLSTALSVAYGLEAGGVIVNWSSAVRTENLPFGGAEAERPRARERARHDAGDDRAEGHPPLRRAGQRGHRDGSGVMRTIGRSASSRA